MTDSLSMSGWPGAHTLAVTDCRDRGGRGRGGPGEVGKGQGQGQAGAWDGGRRGQG